MDKQQIAEGFDDARGSTSRERLESVSGKSGDYGLGAALFLGLLTHVEKTIRPIEGPWDRIDLFLFHMEWRDKKEDRVLLGPEDCHPRMYADLAYEVRGGITPTLVRVVGNSVRLTGAVAAEVYSRDELTIPNWTVDALTLAWDLALREKELANLRLAELMIENTLRITEVVDCGEAGAAWSAALDAVREKIAQGAS